MSTQVIPSPRAGGPASWGRRWLAGWGSLTLLLTDVVTAGIALSAWVVLLACVLTIPGAAIGLLLVIPALRVCGLLGHVERHRVSALTGATIHPPTPAGEQPIWRRLWFDRHCWRSAAYLVLHSIWGLVAGAITLGVLAQSLLVLALPLYASRLPDTGLRLLGLVTVDGGARLSLLWLAALAVLLALPLLARLASTVDVMLARWLLGRDEAQVVEQLTARVDTLTETRQQTVDSVEAERRRIERDLHDGPQQRLVSIAMTLGMAKEAMDRDPQAASALLTEAHTSAKEAIVEMRHVARGIVPPVLADRGLDAALSALAARCPIPVDVRVRGVGRLDPTIEAIAYFVVSEALTNVAKHSGANRARVDVAIHGDGLGDGLGGGLGTTAAGPHVAGDTLRTGTPGRHLAITVGDDGRGGADPTRGTGLTGLRQRVGSVDGDLQVRSPEGGPTTLSVRLPLRPTTAPLTGRSPR